VASTSRAVNTTPSVSGGTEQYPLGGRWPTSLWLPGVPLDDVHTNPLPENLPPGTYELLVGPYDPETGERLPLPDGNDALRLADLGLP